MLKSTKKRIIIGIVGFIISLALSALTFYFYSLGTNTEISFGRIMLMIATGLSFASIVFFIFLIFTNIKSAFYFALAVCVIVSAKFLSVSLNQTADNVDIFIPFLAIMYVFVITKSYKSARFAIRGVDYNDASDSLKQITNDNFTSVIVAYGFGHIYQVIKYYNNILFHHLGNTINGIDSNKIITNFDEIADYISVTKGRDFVINRGEVSSIKVNLKEDLSVNAYGMVKIKQIDGKTKDIYLMEQMSKEQLIDVFGENIEIKDTSVSNEEVSIDKNYKKKLNNLNNYIYIFSILSIIIFVSASFFSVEYARIFLPICVLLAIADYIVFIVFNKYLTIDKEKDAFDVDIKNGKLSYFFPFILFPIMLFIEAIPVHFYNLVSCDYMQLLLISLAVFILLLSLYFVFVKGKKKFNTTLVVIISLIILSVSSVATINSTLDFSAPQEISCEVVQKYITSLDKNNNKKYKLKIKLNDNEITIDIDKEKYGQTNVGDYIVLKKYKGLLGIERIVM